MPIVRVTPSDGFVICIFFRLISSLIQIIWDFGLRISDCLDFGFGIPDCGFINEAICLIIVFRSADNRPQFFYLVFHNLILINVLNITQKHKTNLMSHIQVPKKSEIRNLKPAIQSAVEKSNLGVVNIYIGITK